VSILDALENALGLKTKTTKGRFSDEFNIAYFDDFGYLLTAKVFLGRGYYAQWVELFDVEERFYESPIERKFYELLYNAMSNGSVLYVEYVNDRKTWMELQRGVSLDDCRLCRVLKNAGFKVARDLYFPEGGREGAQKLQALKSIV